MYLYIIPEGRILSCWLDLDIDLKFIIDVLGVAVVVAVIIVVADVAVVIVVAVVDVAVVIVVVDVDVAVVDVAVGVIIVAVVDLAVDVTSSITFKDIKDSSSKHKVMIAQLH